MGLWKVVEYERSTNRTIKVWRFQSFREADAFRQRREEVYAMVGLDATNGLSKALPEISKLEVDAFQKIMENPELLGHVMRSFNL